MKKQIFLSILSIILSALCFGQTQVNLPVTFDITTVNYDLVDFGGNASSIVNDPVLPSNKACKVIKSNTAELWAGTTIGGTTGGFATAIPFAPGSTTMTMRVYSPDAGIPVRMKVEDPSDPTKSVETQVNTTLANAWETLTFNFANQASGTAPINFSYVYKKLSVFFNFGTTGAVAGTKTYYFDDVIFVAPALVQVNLPVTFDNSNVNYDLVDFGGNASSIVNDPVLPSNKACKVIKSNTAELWAGTTIGGTTGGFATAIPFAPGYTTMTMRVYSPDAGIPVRMKVEDPNDPTKSVETQVNTTLANAWETLTFNFANQASGTAPINFSYVYKKLSVFFNFGTTGAVAGTKTYYFDDVIFVAPVLVQVNLPVTFDNSNVNYDLVDFGGNASSIVNDPVLPSNKACKVIKSNTAELWAGTTIGGTTGGFATAIPFAPWATIMTMRVYSPNAGIPVRMKVEDPNDPTKSVETQVNTTTANAWETLTFNFANQASGTAPINYTYVYKKLSVFFNFGTTGAVAGTKTYYFDDVVFVVPVQVTLPVTFENTSLNYDLVDFGGTASSIVTDPLSPPNRVCKVIKSNTAQFWAGTTIGGTTGGFATAIPFAPGSTVMSVRVYSPDAGIPVRLKVEDPMDPTKSVETQVLTSATNDGWETLVFNFANQASGTPPINFSYTYKKLSIFFNFGTTGATAGTKTYYFDDVIFGFTPIPVNLPVTFDNSTINYDLVDFGGNSSSIVTDPVSSANKACKVIKSNTAELWAGTTIGGSTGGFATPIPFLPGFTTMSVKVFSPDAGIPVRLKVEDPNNPSRSVETQVSTTVANAWQTLIFNFANQASGTQPINFSYTYKKLSIFFNFGTTGAVAGTKTYYFDDVVFGGVSLSQVNLPVTFDDPTVNYDLVDFGGNASAIVADPVAPPNKVCKVLKTNTAELWAGTTMGGSMGGFASAIPFAVGATTISIKIYSPDAGTPVRLKAEDSYDPTKSVETQVNTTVANAWETLTFNFANQVPGTAPINYTYIYKKLSVFFNFGTTGAAAGSKTYYFDDVVFGGNVPVALNVTFQVQSPDSIPVYIFGNWSNWGNWPGDQMTPIGNNKFATTLTLQPGNNYEFLYVNGTGPTKEVLNPSWPCTNGNPQYTNRVVGLGNADTTICYTWASCASCDTPPADSINVTFQVQNPDSIPVYIFGNWNNWTNWPGTPMNSIGNSKYVATLKLSAGQTIEYLFVNGVGPTKEVLDPAWSCTNGNQQYTNRLTTLGSSDTTICYLWSTCSSCGTTATNDISSDDLRVYLGKDGLRIFSGTLSEIDQVAVYDILGRTLFISENTVDVNHLIPVQLSVESFYIVKMKVNNRVQTFKGSVIK